MTADAETLRDEIWEMVRQSNHETEFIAALALYRALKLLPPGQLREIRDEVRQVTELCAAGSVGAGEDGTVTP